MDPSLISFVREDAVAFLSRLVQENAERIRNNQPAKYFDLIICDPPKLAPSRQSITPAVKKYVEINSLAMALLDPVNGGYLCTFSCSAHITQRQILSDIMKSAASAPLKQVGDLPTRHRHVDILKTLYPGMDHPLNIEFLDGAYLSGYLVHVS
jgi:23S rRNA (cytosine1962-C5)-methyltransferase